MLTKSRVALIDYAFRCAIGSTRDQATTSLRKGISGIRRINSGMVGGFISSDQPMVRSANELSRFLSSRFLSEVVYFRDQLAELNKTHGDFDKVYVVTRGMIHPYFLSPGADKELFSSSLIVQWLVKNAGVQVKAEDIVFMNCACSSGIMAINNIARSLEIKPGKALILGIENEISPANMVEFKKIGAVNSEEDIKKSCLPFSKARKGLVPGETLVAAVLQTRLVDDRSENHIFIRAGYATSDAYRITDGLENGFQIKRCLQKTLGELDVSDIDFICAHATSTPMNDFTEGSAISEFCLSRKTPMPVVPLKSYLGHTFNSSGLLESVLCADLLKQEFLPRMICLDSLEEFPAIEYIAGTTSVPISRALKLSIGFGGINAALILEKINARA